jgi:hypothetical protein
MEGRKPMALWLELEQQLPTWLSSEGGEERKRRSSRDGVVYAMAPRLVLRIAAGRSSDLGAGVTSKPIEEYQGRGKELFLRPQREMQRQQLGTSKINAINTHKPSR